MAKIRCSAHAMEISSVEAVLDLHAGVLREVDEALPTLVFLSVVLHSHEHVECLVRFSLAVGNALLLLLVLSSSEVKVDAVFVALFE